MTQTPTRRDVLDDPAVHVLTKSILLSTFSLDLLDAYYDIKLAADVLRAELDALLDKVTS